MHASCCPVAVRSLPMLWHSMLPHGPSMNPSTRASPPLLGGCCSSYTCDGGLYCPFMDESQPTCKAW